MALEPKLRSIARGTVEAKVTMFADEEKPPKDGTAGVPEDVLAKAAAGVPRYLGSLFVSLLPSALTMLVPSGNVRSNESESPSSLS